jgi:hypothetical protein
MVVLVDCEKIARNLSQDWTPWIQIFKVIYCFSCLSFFLTNFVLFSTFTFFDYSTLWLTTNTRNTPLSSLFLFIAYLNFEFPGPFKFHSQNTGGKNFVYEGIDSCLGSVFGRTQDAEDFTIAVGRSESYSDLETADIDEMKMKDINLLPYILPNVFAISQSLTPSQFASQVLPSLKPSVRRQGTTAKHAYFARQPDHAAR